ncbi:hypothetical protein [Mycobacterium sp. 1245805.9]|uniref:hypothetical protein n=1 Tax=Mycobacterium sp. 1245805.9 TaxID=1856862 RepID=UPI0012E9D13B|nr:hypothetical protein [Mycobacterium sp. 1245805.9]
MGFLETSKDFKRSTQVMLILSLLIGIVLLAGLWLNDAGVNVTLGGFDPKQSWLRRYNADWFHNHAYIPNVLAGFTGFLIGAPVATVVLATFTIQREEKAALDKVNRISVLAWKAFRDAVMEFCSEQRIQALDSGAAHVQRTNKTAIHDLSGFISLMFTDTDESHPDHTAIRKQHDQLAERLLQSIRRDARLLETALNNVSESVTADRALQVRWSTVKGAWNMLDQYVRIQRLERNLLWFDSVDSEIDSEIRASMSRDGNPISLFSSIHESTGNWNPPQSMSDALDSLKSYALRDRGQLRDHLLGNRSVYGWTSVDEYQRRAKEAAEFLRGLRTHVEKVDAANWPESARKPVFPGP